MQASPKTRQGTARRSIGKVARPSTLRTQSEAIKDDDENVSPSTPLTLTRQRSYATPARLARLSTSPKQQSPVQPFSPTQQLSTQSCDQTHSSISSIEHTQDPTSCGDAASQFPQAYAQEVSHFDFTKIDYELERARKLGSGLWSNVFLSESRLTRLQTSPARSTPPDSSRASISSGAVFAIKVPARRDAAAVLEHEAKVLSHLQYFTGASQYIVTFYGLDPRNGSLIFEAVVGGSLEDLSNRLRHMTDYARHQEVVQIFPGLAHDLVAGLEFIHAAGVVHADIKPQNILLDVSDHYSLPVPVIRARYIDFSAAFVPTVEDSMPAGGGTWDFMAPEQMRVQKDMSKPTFKSDIWSLGISLLQIIVLGSPYAAACKGNMFMLREAIKSGDPLGFAKMDLKVKESIDACQGFIDCCRLALHKDREKRISATAWRRWLEEQDV